MTVLIFIYHFATFHRGAHTPFIETLKNPCLIRCVYEFYYHTQFYRFYTRICTIYKLYIPQIKYIYKNIPLMRAYRNRGSNIYGTRNT